VSERTNKIAIIGAGGVGATVAYACMIRGIGKQFALYDIDPKKVKSQALDLTHGL
jgi:L-lactate dehydrogenase